MVSQYRIPSGKVKGPYAKIFNNHNTTLQIDGVPVSLIKKKAVRVIQMGKRKGMLKLSNKRVLTIKLAQRDGMQCRYCESPLTFKWMPQRKGYRIATFDHMLAESKGGKWILENGCLACGHCNSHKGSMDYDVFVAKVAQGHYTPEAVQARQVAKVQMVRDMSIAKYNIREKKRKWNERKEMVVNLWKRVYNVFNIVNGELV